MNRLIRLNNSSINGGFVIAFILLLCFSFSFYGCGGGGSSSSTAALYGGPSNLSVKLNMSNRTPSQAYVSIPANAVGTVNIVVRSNKSQNYVTFKEGFLDSFVIANKTVDYSLNSFTFENQIPAGDTYSVTVTARLKERANDIYESVWQGSGIVAVLNAENALKHPGANEVSVTLVFKTIEYIKLYPSKIIFDPVLPVSEITTSTIIPSFKLSVLDQFGNTMTSENNLISVSLENGSFKDSITSKNLVNGSVYFNDLAVAGLIPDSAGYIKLKASYGSLAAYSQPVKTVGVIVPNASVAGYLNDEAVAAAASAAYKSNAPLANKLLKAVCGSIQYSVLTDSAGFFKLDVKTDSAEQAVYLEFTNSAGAVVKLQLTAVRGKTKLANIKIDKNGAASILTSMLAAAYDPLADISIIKKAVDDEIAAKASSGSVSGISGRALDAASKQPVAGALITINGQPGLSASSDSAGNFIINAPAGVLTAGDYAVTCTAAGFNAVSKNINITSFDYGFVIESVLFEAVQKINNPPSLVIKSVSGASRNISIVFDLIDADGDLCNIDVYYSLNGGYSYFSTINAGGSLSNTVPGSALSAVWFSASDFLSKQTSVRLKLVPRDSRSTGTAGESGIFTVDNQIVDPENNPPVIMGVIASSGRGDIAVKYDLIDQDGDSCAVELYYSLDGGATFTRSVNYSIYNQRVFPGSSLSVVWNSALDFQSEEKSVRLRLTPNDSKSGGTPGESSIFEVNNIVNTPPVIQNLKAAGNYKNISLVYDLIELDGHLCTIEVAYSLDGGLNYLNTVNLSGETSSVAAGQSKTLTWLSYNDFTSTNKNIFVKLTPSDKYGYGTEAVFGPFEINNGGGRPEIKGLTVTGASQIIDISYGLSDIDSSLCTIEVYYSLNGGASFRQTGYVEGDIHSVAPGANKLIKWNSYGDFRTREKSVVLKLLPIDNFGAGTESVSLLFEVNNNINRPSIANLITKVDSGEVLITYDINDADGSTCQVGFQYATEKSGGYLNSFFVTGETAEVFTGPAKTLLWRSKNDFTKNYDSVSVKLTVSDGEGFGAEAVSAPFKVYNNATGEIYINSVAGSSQDITFDYNLTDAEGDLFNIAVYYSRDGGATFTATANVSGSISNVAPANNLKLVWQSAKDIVNQNASGVLLKIAALNLSGAVESESISQPFAVNNYTPPPVVVPALQSAEMISDKKLKLTFSVPVTVSDTAATLVKIKVNGFVFDPQNDDTLTHSSNSVIITANSPSFTTIFRNAQTGGITVNESTEGLKFLSGNGIKSSTGAEVAANSTGFSVSPDTTPPDQLTAGQLSLISYSNAVQKVSTSGEIEFSKNLYFQVYISSTPPGEATTPLGESESYISGSTSPFPSVLVSLSSSPLSPGDTVYYRLKDRAGNKTQWQADGVIPSAPPVEVLKWSNASMSAFNTSVVGSTGDKLKIYENTSGGSYNYCAVALNAASAGGYPAGLIIQCSGSPVSDNSDVYYTLVNQSGNESDHTSGGTVPAPPESLIVSNLKLRYNTTGAYEIKNNHNIDFSLAGRLRVIINDGSVNTVIGRIIVSTLYSGSYVGSAGYDASESLNGDGLKTSMVNGGTLKFSYVNDSNGNESSYNSDSTTPGLTDHVAPRPDFNNIIYVSPETKLKILSTIGVPGDKIQVYEKSGGVYSYKAETISSGLFSAGSEYTLSQSFSIATNGSASYTLKGSSGNESVISDDTHLAGVLDHFVFNLTSPQTSGTAFSGTNQLFARDYYAQTVMGFDASVNNVTITVNSGPAGTITGLGSGSNNILNQAGDFVSGTCSLSGMIFSATGGVGIRTFKATADGKTGTSGNVAFDDYFTITSKVVGNVDGTHGWDDGASTEEGGHVELTVTAKNIDGTTNIGYAGDGFLSIASTTGVVQWEGAYITDNLNTNSDNAASYAASAFSNGVAYIYVRNSRAGNDLAVTVMDGMNANFDGTINLTWTAETIPSAFNFEGENSKGFRKYSCVRDSSVKIIKIPAGPFERGDGTYGGSAATMRMSAYYTAESHTTNQQFQNWRNSTTPPVLQGEWKWDTNDPSGTKGQDFPAHPAINVTWNDAKRYSYWLMTGAQSAAANDVDDDSQYMPSEAQYEKAARGVKFMNWTANNAANKTWPWGTTVPSDDSLCNTGFTQSGDERNLGAGKGTRVISTYNPMGYYGLQDIAGNAWQWCRDWWDGPAYPEAAGTLDPLHNTVGTNRVLRGGSWYESSDAFYFRASYRSNVTPGNQGSHYAFRPVLKP
jgi:formylglycine-generating enzyme required for sulfatase activity